MAESIASHDSQDSKQVIVAAVDGSDASQAIIQWGWALAERSGSVLRLVVVSEQPMERHTSASIRSLAETILGPQLDGERLEVAVLHGVPFDAILAEVDQCDASLLVMGRRGHGRLSTLRLGSVSNRCTDRATRPVLVVDGFHEPLSGPVVVGTDGSPGSATAIDWAAEVAVLLSTSLLVVGVWHPPAFTQKSTGLNNEQLEEIYATDATVAVEEAAERCARKFPGLTVELAKLQGPAGSTLVQTAKGRQALMLVVGYSGRGPVSTAIGSVARSCLGEGSLAVAVVHPS